MNSQRTFLCLITASIVSSMLWLPSLSAQTTSYGGILKVTEISERKIRVVVYFGSNHNIKKNDFLYVYLKDAQGTLSIKVGKIKVKRVKSTKIKGYLRRYVKMEAKEYKKAVVVRYIDSPEYLLNNRMPTIALTLFSDYRMLSRTRTLTPYLETNDTAQMKKTTKEIKASYVTYGGSVRFFPLGLLEPLKPYNYLAFDASFWRGGDDGISDRSIAHFLKEETREFVERIRIDTLIYYPFQVNETINAAVELGFSPFTQTYSIQEAYAYIASEMATKAAMKLVVMQNYFCIFGLNYYLNSALVDEGIKNIYLINADPHHLSFNLSAGYRTVYFRVGFRFAWEKDGTAMTFSNIETASKNTALSLGMALRASF